MKKERYERPKFYMGTNALQKMAESGIEMQRTYLVDTLFPKKKEMHFSKGWLKLGSRIKPNAPGYDPAKDSFMFDVRTHAHTLVLGKTGSGKTSTLRRMADYFHHSGFACVFLTDIKDEMKSSLQAADERIARVLDQDEFPKALPIRTYRPVFFSRFYNEPVPKDNLPFQLAYKDLHISEILTLLGFTEDSNRNQRSILTSYWEEAGSLEELRSLIDKELGGSQKSIKESILRAIDPLIRYKVLGKEATGDFVKDLREGFIPVLNVKRFKGVSVGSASVPQVYVSVILRKIAEACDPEHRRIRKPVAVFIDESPKFLVPGTLTYTEFIDAVDTYRSLNIYIIFAAQTDDRVPEAIIKQCRYTFLPFNIDVDTTKRILKFNQYFMYHPDDIEQVADVLYGLQIDTRTGWRQWVVVDSNKTFRDRRGLPTVWNKFWALPPLSAHYSPTI